MAPSTFIAIGKLTRKDSATCPENSGSVGDVSNNAYIDVVKQNMTYDRANY